MLRKNRCSCAWIRVESRHGAFLPWRGDAPSALAKMAHSNARTMNGNLLEDKMKILVLAMLMATLAPLAAMAAQMDEVVYCDKHGDKGE